MKQYIFWFLTILSLSASTSYATTCSKLKAPVCHAGSESNPNYVNLCVDFGAVWGHLAQHQLDTYGVCQNEQSLKAYACNAGLRHQSPTGPICIQSDQDNRIVSSCGNSTNCSCTTGSDWTNLHLSDYMMFQIAPYSETVAPNDFVTQRLSAAPGPEFARAAPNQAGYIISDSYRFTFNLGSERIGADYFVDLCWKNTITQPEQYEYDVEAAMTVADGVLGSSDYLDSANVKSKFEIYCDTRTSGATVYPSAPQYASNLSIFSGGTKTYAKRIKGARSCFLRHYFKEYETDHLRPQNLKQVTVINDLEILPTTNTQAEPVTICHVKQVQGNKYSCQTKQFANAETYKQYVLTYNNITEWHQDHQHDYQGACAAEGPCQRLQ